MDSLLHGVHTVLDDAPHNVEPRLQVMFIILAISLFAVSFPGVSKAIPFLRIPGIVFFVGKHFGTGVILATAFIHLLQDSFEALQKPLVKEKYHRIGKYTGLIILASLLTIFLIEYLSTSYVDHLHAGQSLPTTPNTSRQHSRAQSRSRGSTPSSSAPPLVSVPLPHHSQQQPSPNPDETTALLRPTRTQSTPQIIQPYAHGHTHAHMHHSHLPPLLTPEVPFEVLTNSPRIIRMGVCGACPLEHPCVCTGTFHEDPSAQKGPSKSRSRSKSRFRATVTASLRPASGSTGDVDIEAGDGSTDTAISLSQAEKKPRIGRRRQIIGLLVLQLGIMIHSLVIGLTLSITTGADFTSLTTAVIFHQLFEGLSLGIRIAALPPRASQESVVIVEESLSTAGAKQDVGIGINAFKRSLVRFGRKCWNDWFKLVLTLSFGITTPSGMALGMIAFKVKNKNDGDELARMYLIQGLMSAISAGMLIYASTVEMIAGDFVFGDVEGHGHSHGHNHGHSHDIMTDDCDDDESTPTNIVENNNLNKGQGNVLEENAGAILQTNGEPDQSHYGHHHHHHHPRHGRIGKKILALVSLLAGVGGMVLVGLGE